MAGVRVGKYNLGTRASKCKVSAVVGKHKLRARAVRYKLGTRAGKHKLGARVGKSTLGTRIGKYKLGARAGTEQRTGGREIQRPLPVTYYVTTKRPDKFY